MVSIEKIKKHHNFLNTTNIYKQQLNKEESIRQTLEQIRKELDDIYWDFPFKKIDVRIAVLAYMRQHQRMDTGMVKEDYLREVKKFTDRLSQLTELCQKTQYALDDFESLYLIKP